MRLAALPLLALLLGATACAQPLADDARKERIVANLRFEFPQLASTNLVVNEIEPSEVPGLERGTFTINGQQEQAFFVTEDDTQLFLVVAEPIDASRDVDGLAEAERMREEEAMAEARERTAMLNDAFEGLPVRGNPDAPITVVEFSDFECPYCSRAVPTVDQLLEENDDVRLIYVQYPLPNHPWARPASIAALCAAQQDPDAFWTLHDRYFEDQQSLNPGNVTERTEAYLAGTDVDMDEWGACMNDADSEAHRAAVARLDAGMALASEVGVSGTPAFFVNGRFLNGAQPLEAFEALVEEARSDAE